MSKPDWSEWKHKPWVKVWQAVALSLNIDPLEMQHSRESWLVGPGRGPIFEDESFANEKIKKDFYKRIRVLSANYLDREFFSPGDIYVGQGAGFQPVKLSECAAWAPSVDWDVPKELKELARTKAASNLTPIKKGALLKRLGQRYPKLSNAMQANEKDFKDCRVPNAAAPGQKSGFYYLENVEALCAARWKPTDPSAGGIMPRTVKPLGK